MTSALSSNYRRLPSQIEFGRISFSDAHFELCVAQFVRYVLNDQSDYNVSVDHILKEKDIQEKFIFIKENGLMWPSRTFEVKHTSSYDKFASLQSYNL